jgi:hypothetical protein
VFALGNAVTGKGNIQISFKHGRLVGLHVCEYLRGQPALTPTKVAAIEAEIKSLQEKVGYSGNYKEWIAKPRHFDRPVLSFVEGLARPNPASDPEEGAASSAPTIQMPP